MIQADSVIVFSMLNVGQKQLLKKGACAGDAVCSYRTLEGQRVLAKLFLHSLFASM